MSLVAGTNEGQTFGCELKSHATSCFTQFLYQTHGKQTRGDRFGYGRRAPFRHAFQA